MSTALINRDDAAAEIERVLVGDLGKLSTEQRLEYYKRVCESVGLNPLTRPLEYITLNGRLTLYAKKDATDQLRQVHGVSVTIVSRDTVDGCCVVTARATMPNGRKDESIGAVSIGSLKGDALCNGLMKAETKAKRRVTLSICGLGLLDETEIETIPESRKKEVAVITEEVVIGGPDTESRVPAKSSGETAKAADAGVEPQTNGSAPVETEYIGRTDQRDFHIAFREALPEDTQKHADELAADWLKGQGFVNDLGRPSTKVIPKAVFSKTVEEATKWAKGLRV